MKLKHKHIGIKLVLLFFLFTVSLLPVHVIGQVKFTTQVNERQIAQNEYLQVEYTIENAKSVENFAYSPFKNFRIIQGPVQSSGMSVTNGVMTQYKGMSFVLQPLTAGKIVVPGATAVVDGRVMRSNAIPLQVTVSAANNRPSITPSSPSWPDVRPQVNEEYTIAPDENMADKVKNNLMVVSQVNKTTCYEGEPIVATYKLYSRLRSESRVVKRPSLNGFSVFDMVDPESNTPGVETLNGKSYNVHIIRKTQLFPLQAGTFVLDPVELENKVRFIKTNIKKSARKNSIQQFLDEFMSDDGGEEMEEHTFNLGSKPVTVIVKPLPLEKRPPNFNGAVGNFQVKSSLKNNNPSAGDAIEFSVIINGQGNFTVVNPPVLNLPAGFESYDPVIKENVDKTIYPLKGEKTFTYTLVAKNGGDYTIPPVTFSYFDPSKAAYHTETTDSFRVHVNATVKKEKGNGSLGISGITRGHVNWLPLQLVLGVIAALTISALIFYQYRISRKQKKSIAGVSNGKPKRPAGTPSKKLAEPSLPQDPLLEARSALELGQSQRFYREINKAAWKIISDTLNLPATAMNKPNAISTLKHKGVNVHVIENFESVLNACEMALYTPVHEVSDMHLTLDKADAFIKHLRFSLS